MFRQAVTEEKVSQKKETSEKLHQEPQTHSSSTKEQQEQGDSPKEQQTQVTQHQVKPSPKSQQTQQTEPKPSPTKEQQARQTELKNSPKVQQPPQDELNPLSKEQYPLQDDLQKSSPKDELKPSPTQQDELRPTENQKKRDELKLATKEQEEQIDDSPKKQQAQVTQQDELKPSPNKQQTQQNDLQKPLLGSSPKDELKPTEQRIQHDSPQEQHAQQDELKPSAKEQTKYDLQQQQRGKQTQQKQLQHQQLKLYQKHQQRLQEQKYRKQHKQQLEEKFIKKPETVAQGNNAKATENRSETENDPVSEQASSDYACPSCSIKKTGSWRKGPNGTTVCNACGIRWLRQGISCKSCDHVPRHYRSNMVCPRCGGHFTRAINEALVKLPEKIRSKIEKPAVTKRPREVQPQPMTVKKARPTMSKPTSKDKDKVPYRHEETLQPTPTVSHVRPPMQPMNTPVMQMYYPQVPYVHPYQALPQLPQQVLQAQLQAQLPMGGYALQPQVMGPLQTQVPATYVRQYTMQPQNLSLGQPTLVMPYMRQYPVQPQAPRGPRERGQQRQQTGMPLDNTQLHSFYLEPAASRANEMYPSASQHS
eukprot:m.161313 g.161313  ORF g.161313 m.161313 type:complete len:591 (+) comp15186_c0_seq3:193-1965(+)